MTPSSLPALKITGARVIVTCSSRNFVTPKIETTQIVYGIGDATLNSREVRAAKYPFDPKQLPAARLEDGAIWN